MSRLTGKTLTAAPWGSVRSVFELNPAGNQVISFGVPTNFVGLVVGFQSVIFNTVSLIGLSNAVELTIM